MRARAWGAVAALVLLGGIGWLVYEQLREPPACEVCYRPLHEETYFEVVLPDGEAEHICCARCGVRFLAERGGEVAAVRAADYATRRLVDGTKAYYVEGSRVHLCSAHLAAEDRTGSQYQVAWDRCLPSLVAFESKEAAERFREENGGVVKTWPELLEEENEGGE